ncbi:MAG: glycosyltransferase, partial [Thermoanaerobaculia bacterium]
QQRVKHARRVFMGAPMQFARLFLIRVRRRLRRYRRTFRIWRIRARRRIVRRAMLPTRYRMLDRRMAKEAVRFGADLYWANDVTTVRSAYAAAKATTARVVYDAHEIIWDAPTVSSFHRRLWGAVERWHIRKVDGVSTVCDPIADEMVRRYRIARPVVILNCPRLSETATAGYPKDSPLNEFRRPGEKIVLFHGSLSPWRGLEQLIQAHALLPDEYRLVILGHGIFRKTLEGLVEQNGVADRVTFLHSVPPAALPRWLVGADCGVIPYQRIGLNHEYSTPNKLFEYMHVGIPIVVNDLPEIRRIVTEVGFGLVADCSDPAPLAKGIQELLSDPERLRTMMANAKAAAARYSWDAQEEKILQTLP